MSPFFIQNKHFQNVALRFCPPNLPILNGFLGSIRNNTQVCMSSCAQAPLPMVSHLPLLTRCRLVRWVGACATAPLGPQGPPNCLEKHTYCLAVPRASSTSLSQNPLGSHTANGRGQHLRLTDPNSAILNGFKGRYGGTCM